MARGLERDGEQRVAEIIEVNTAQRKIIVRDYYNTAIQISLQFFESLIEIPIVGERWIVERRGVDWYLHKKANTNSIAHLNQGDTELSASTINLKAPRINLITDDIYLNSEEVSKITTLNNGEHGQTFRNVNGTPSWITTPSFGTTLPTDPIPGDQFVYEPFNWQFTYHNGWQFTGGPTKSVFVYEPSTPGVVNSWNELVIGASPTIMIPFPGEYLVSFSGMVNAPAAGGSAYIGVAVNGINPGGEADAKFQGVTLASNAVGCISMTQTPITVTNIGIPITLRYYASSTLMSYTRKTLSVTPIRVN